MGAQKMPKKHEWGYNGHSSNKKGAWQKIFCPQITDTTFIWYFRVPNFLHTIISHFGATNCAARMDMDLTDYGLCSIMDHELDYDNNVFKINFFMITVFQIISACFE